MNFIRPLIQKNAFAYKVVGIVISILVGITVDVTGIVETSGEAFLVSLVLILLTLIFDSEAQSDLQNKRIIEILERNHQFLSEETANRIRWETYFARHIQVQEPQLEAGLVDSVRDSLSNSQAALVAFPRGLVGARVTRSWGRVVAETRLLSQGRYVDVGADCTVTLIEATKNCNTNLKAVTTVTPDPTGALGTWWRTEGRGYLQENLNAAKRGVSISRIVLCPDAVLTAENRADLEQLFRVGEFKTIKTFIFPLSEVSTPKNITIWDDAACWRADMDTQGKISGGTYSEDHEDVTELVEYFSRLSTRLLVDTP